MGETPQIRAPLPPPEARALLPPDGGPAFNRLIHETSPYLLQHARNPVDWFPWGAEALARAKREDKPIFLSVGYSSCHWCHVMEHESFEDETVARLLNEFCVPVKVDREERPDLDDLYLVATQVMTGRGGWPNSVWLLPDGRPWYAGTYFPREDRGGSPGFKTLLRRLDEIWRTRRTDVVQQAEALANAIRQNAAAVAKPPQAAPLTDLDGLVADAITALGQDYDRHHGGFGAAPKFPPHSALRLLLREYERTRQPDTLALVTGTLDAMQAGGFFDQIGGGFHRYATDARWFLPHFEKMLYDNAQLARVYAEAYRLTADTRYEETARATFDWVLRDMADPAGGFHSALDADSEGEEGRFYVWTPDEVERVLGKDTAGTFVRLFGFSPGGNFQDEATGRSTGANIVYRAQPIPADQAEAMRAARLKLRAVRAMRVWPSRDDKVLAAWNGLMIGALAIGSRDLREPRYREAAERATSFFLSKMMPGGRLMRSWCDRRARIPGYLDDYAALADGLLDLHEVTGEARWRNEALRLARDMIRLFRDEQDGAFFFTAADHEQLLIRSKDAFDQAVPSGNGLAARVLIRMGHLLKRRAWAEQGADVLRALSPMMARSPTGAGTLLEVAAMHAEEAGTAPFARKGPVTLVVEAPAEARRGLRCEVTLRLLMDEGWHVNAHEGIPSGRVATVLTADDGWEVAHPPGTGREKAGEKWVLYEDEVLLKASISWPQETVAGTRDAAFHLRAQPCDDTRCLPPVDLEVRAAIRVIE